LVVLLDLGGMGGAMRDYQIWNAVEAANLFLGGAGVGFVIVRLACLMGAFA
jgi:hypothetical protein